MNKAVPMRNWIKPLPGRVKVNVHAAFFRDSGKGGAGIVARNAEGAVIFTATRVLFHCSDAEEAELLGC